MSNLIMRCGCRANGKTIIKDKEIDSCVTHSETEAMPNQPDLRYRMASCHYCDAKGKSVDNLAFFIFRPSQEYDDFYCGCKGWD